MATNELGFNWDQPFEEAVKYLIQKMPKISPDSWRNIWKEAHARAFTVAQVTSADILTSIQDAIDAAQKEGQTLEQFKDEIEPILESKGWLAPAGEPEIDALTGRKRLTGWRLNNIFHTNLAGAYSSGRYTQQMENRRRRPYLQYHITPRPTNRDEHKKQNKKVYLIHNKYWNTWYPPNGFNCGCYVTALTKNQVESRGLKVETKTTKEKPDEGWDYHVGKAGLDELKPDFKKYDKRMQRQLKSALAKNKKAAAALEVEKELKASA